MKKKPKIVKKPWGREIWIIVTDKYALKRLEINKGSRFSLQYHRYKTETWLIESGKIKCLLGNKNMALKPGDIVHVPKRTVHRLEAITKSSFIEVSTPQLKDVVRLEDDYGRK